MSKKTLCDWTKEDIHKNYEKLYKIVSNPKFICTKCARVSGSEKYLCKKNRKKLFTSL